MGTYKGIQGYLVETLASDPGTLSEVQGKLWYNTTSNTWKLATDSSGAWATGTVLNQGRNIAGYAGTSQTSALIFGGSIAYPYNFPGRTEQYNGTTWTELTNQTTARARGGSNGTATSALWFGGFPAASTTGIALTEAWNGTGWTEVADLNAVNKSNTGAGGPATATAALSIGGTPESAMEIWDGTSWTAGTALDSPGSNLQACGTSTAALTIGGSPTPREKFTEEWNGTGWTELADSNNNRVSGGASGTSTAAIQFGGYDSTQPAPTNTVNVEVWNGTAWTEVANMATALTNTGGASISSSSTIKIGGYTGPPSDTYSNITEEWASGPTAVTVTTS